jgi:hypothetical protein
MLNLEGKTIIYLTDVASPGSQAGKMGDVREVTRAWNFAANFLLRGGDVRVIEESQVHEVRVELGLEKPKKPKKRATVNVRTRSDSEGNQKSDTGKKETATAG